MAKFISISNQTFRDFIEGDFVYVDKTRHIYNLVRRPKGIYFISRPRRFGKSVMVSTLDELFQGNRDLFKGLWIDSSDYDWQAYPVIRIDFSLNGVNSVPQLEKAINSFLNQVADRHEISLRGFDYQSNLSNLTQDLAKKYDGKVVLLIDEYDKPITDNLLDMEMAIAIRDALRNFYGVVKGLDAYWRFIFITGISPLNILSMIHNISDLTMDASYATILGFTTDELTKYLPEHLNDFAARKSISSDELLDKICWMYGGFRFSSNLQSVCNPFSTMIAIKQQHFANFCLSTDIPTFLAQILQTNDYDLQALEYVEVDDLTLNTYEIDSFKIEPLLIRAGYLSIKEEIEDEGDPFEAFAYTYPNYEARQVFVA